MGRIFTGVAGDNLQSATPIQSGQPSWRACWFKPNGLTANNVFILTDGVSGSSHNLMGLGYDSGGSGKLAGRSDNTGEVKALSTVAVTDGAWQHGLENNVSNTLRLVWLNGGSKGTSGSNQGPTGINLFRVSGRPDGGAGTHFKGIVAHIAEGNGTLTDQEAAFLGAGGHPRLIKSCTDFWRLNQGASPEAPDKGSKSLTVNGATASNADMPVVATHFIASAIADQTWTQNSAITAIPYGSAFEDVSSAFTLAIYKIGASGGTTTTTAAGTTTRTVPLTAATGFVANDYLTVGASLKTRILNVTGLNALVADDLTFSSGNTVTHFPVSSQSFTGITTDTTSTRGTPTGTQATAAGYFTRAVNSTTGALVADSNQYSITINAAAGGGTASFTAGPTPTATTDGYSFAATLDQTATCYLVVLIKGSAAPTGAQVKSGSPTGFVVRFTQAATATVPFTIAATGLTNPLYDYHLAPDNANGTGAVQSFTNRQKLPAAARQYTTLGALSGTTPLSVVSPALAVGDILDCALVTTPGSYTVIPSAAGDFEVDSASDQSRQFLAFNIYDVSAGAMYYASDSNVVVNDQPPFATGPKTYTLSKAATLDLNPVADVIVDPEGDAMTLTELSALLAGLNLSINGSNHIVGTLPNASSSTLVSLRATDPYGAFGDFNITLAVGQVTLPDFVGLPESAAAITLASLALIEAPPIVQVSPAPAGTVLAQSPVAATVVNVGSTVTFTISAGSLGTGCYSLWADFRIGL